MKLFVRRIFKHRLVIKFKNIIVQDLQIILERLSPLMFFENRYSVMRDKFLSDSQGVLHLGASFGQEAQLYESKNLKVIWIECIPEMIKLLRENIANFEKQIVIEALLSDRHGDERVFFLSSNTLQSSSLFPFDDQYSKVSGLVMVDSLKLKSKRLDKVLNYKSLKDYNYWVVDLQGAELEALRGAGRLLDLCLVLDIEISLCEIYRNGTRFDELDSFLKRQGFTLATIPPRGYHGMVVYVRTSFPKADLIHNF